MTSRANDILTPIVPLAPFQKARVECPSRFTWNNWSRQTGKSFTFSLRRVLRGMKRNRNQILLSAGGRQSRELMAKVAMHVKAIRARVDCSMEEVRESLFEGTKYTQLETRVRAANGAFDFRVIGLPANPETARGYTGDVFLDEFAMHRDSREIYGALYPILTRGGGELDVCSTPKGRKNKFYALRGNDQFDHSTVTIEDAKAGGLDVDIEALRAGLGDDLLWQQEFMCQFLDEATAFLTFEMIAECEDSSLDESWNDAKIDACIGEDLYVGFDVGRHRDLSVIWILGRPRGTRLLLTRGVIVMRQMPFKIQKETLYAILQMLNCRRACLDATGLGEQLSEDAADDFGAKVEPVKFTEQSKGSMAGDLRIKVEDHTIRIPASADIRNDWNSIERQVLPGGTIRYAADRGSASNPGHADRFWAAALAVRAAGDMGYVPFKFESAGKLTFAGKGGAW